jgi:hypothetical protein
MRSKYSLISVGADGAPGITLSADQLRDLITKLEAVKPNNDNLPAHVRKYRIGERDLVSIRRELLVKEHHIPYGSVGVVELVKDNGRLLCVRFFCAPSTYITISAGDLQLAV